MGIYAKTDSPALMLAAKPVLAPMHTNIVVESALIHCDVIFGSPRSDCSGAGICKIVDINSGQHIQLKRSCRLAPALLTANPDGNTLMMSFPREFLCIHLLRHHFRTGMLEIQDACSISERVAAGLGLTATAILPGHYAIEEDARGFRIYFSL